MTIQDKLFFCSWSGGKDSCLSYYHAVNLGGKPKVLFTMLEDQATHSRSHGLPLSLLQAQAKAIGVPLKVASASWNEYESVFIRSLNEMKKDYSITHGIFGDIDIEDHRKWEEAVCEKNNLQAYLPLWQEKRIDVLHAFLQAGFSAVIVVVNTSMMDQRFLGRTLDDALMQELESEGVDPCGENGEFHTFVYNGPIFEKAVDFEVKGTVVQGDYVFLELVSVEE